MERFRIGGPDPVDLRTLLGASEVIYIEGDDLDDEYLQILWAHPGFQKARRALGEEFEEYGEHGVFLDSGDLESARKDAASAAYPLRRFAEEWSVSPAAAYNLARTTDSPSDLDDVALFTRFRHEASAVIVWEEEGGYTIYVPRPLTKPRKEAVTDWLKGKKKPGRLEKRWGLAGKGRWQTSPADIEALPWFARWNAGEEPMAIWKSLHEERPELSPDAFAQQLTRLWERMREISAEEIPPKRPSKGPA